MSVLFYELSSRLLVDAVGKMNDNLTSVVLAASVITLTLGYVSKVLLRQPPDADLVRWQSAKQIKNRENDC